MKKGGVKMKKLAAVIVIAVLAIGFVASHVALANVEEAFPIPYCENLAQGRIMINIQC